MTWETILPLWRLSSVTHFFDTTRSSLQADDRVHQNKTSARIRLLLLISRVGELARKGRGAKVWEAVARFQRAPYDKTWSKR